MRILAFADRNKKELIRDPLTLVFGIGFPVVLILMMSFMKNSIEGMPAEIFAISGFAPGMAVFGLSFISLFLGMLISNDRSSSFLIRIFASPMTSFEYILGYSLPLLPIAIVQGGVCFITAFFFGLTMNANILLALIVLIPVSLLFIGLGLLLGSTLTYRQVGGIASIIVNLAAWLSGTWFDLNMIGGAFKTVCYLLPFAHAVDAVKAAISGDFSSILPHLVWVILYALIIFAVAVYSFKRRMKS